MSLKEDDYEAWLDELKTELTSGHPDTGAYSADNQTAADQCNAINRTVTEKKDRDWIRTQFLKLAAGTWARLFDDAHEHTRHEKTLAAHPDYDSAVRIREERRYPATADFVGLFESSSVSVGDALNMRANPVDTLLQSMEDVDNTIGNGAADTARALSDVAVSRATELWGCDTVAADASAQSTGVLQVREQVVVSTVDVETARAR